jgi:uncharacterized membrane protein
MLAVEFYNVVLAVHIMGVVFAFGIVLAYPVIIPWVRRTYPSAMPVVHALQTRIGRAVISPGMVVVLAAGVYLASDADAWSESWVSVPLVILIVVGGLGGAVLTPLERRLATTAARDLEGGGDLGAEYDAQLARWSLFAYSCAALVLVAIVFMTVKPGA